MGRTHLLYPTYFPSISHFVAMIGADEICFEVDDHFQKQTNRNRMYIYSPNGVQMLNIPVKHSSIAHQKTRDVRIEPAFDWQKLHFRSLEAAYRSSPFFEFFEDTIMPVYEKKYTFLADLTFDSMEIAAKCMQWKLQYSKTEEFFHTPENAVDFRNLARGKKDESRFEDYPQVFADRHGFLNNLSILDLIFNEGRHAMAYLKRQPLPIPNTIAP